MQTVQVASPSGVEKLLIVIQVEAIEVSALASFYLLDAKDLPLPNFKGLAGGGFQDVLLKKLPSHAGVFSCQRSKGI
jgi:hypothetical protein